MQARRPARSLTLHGKAVLNRQPQVRPKNLRPNIRRGTHAHFYVQGGTRSLRDG